MLRVQIFPHESTGVSPFRMVFGHDIQLPIDHQNEVGFRKRVPECPAAYVEWLKESLYLGHGIARKKLQVAAARQKKNFQDRSRNANFHPGDWVWKTDSVAKVGKLHAKNLGPYLVLEKTGPVNYKIQGITPIFITVYNFHTYISPK